MPAAFSPHLRSILERGVVIPASPLALGNHRQFDERRQRALWRYYSAAGAGGIAVGVHTTQFAIRDPQIGLLEPVLAVAADEFSQLDGRRAEPLLRIAGICGPTPQAIREAQLARDLGFHAGLLSLGALRDADEPALIDHCRHVAELIPVFGFYLQPAVGGRVLSCSFWRQFAAIDNVVAVKIAPFNRYQTIDVVRAVAESGRDDIALYTGNDDSIVVDLLTTYQFTVGGRVVRKRIVGGLLGHWAVWTRTACNLLDQCHRAVECPAGTPLPDAAGTCESRPLEGEEANAPYRCLLRLLDTAAAVTDMNAAIFDAAHHFAGCIPGVHEVLRRQGLLDSIACLDPKETLSPGQAEEIDRVCRQYPHLVDDAFVQQHLDQWL
ncbi:MAG: dihydrodipicolinate synthase family protein [Planctomycetaceae bacterium]|nr:dihydrodipicolinate synthase family protein [Planctomycetaceae bacterium]